MLKWIRGLLNPGAESINVSAADARQLLQDGALMLDVRSKAERQASSIPGSRHLPVEKLIGQVGQLPEGKVIICQCASGHRSGLAARQLRAQGFDARSLSGGLTAWKNAGFPIKEA